MTHGYGDAPGGWPPPLGTDAPARGGHRRAPDPDEQPDADGGRYDNPVHTVQAPPAPPRYDPPSHGQPSRGQVYGRRAVGRATAPGSPPIGPPTPGSYAPPRQFAPDRQLAPDPELAPDPQLAPDQRLGPDGQFGPDRQFRPPVPRRRAKAGPRPDLRLLVTHGKSILGGAVAVALLVIVGIGALSLINRGSSGDSGRSATPGHDISSRAADPAPLTVAEVFPGPTVATTETDAGYQIVRTQLSTDCAVVAVGDLVATLATNGCTQAVRATVTSADKAFVITIGLLNLRDQAGATATEEAVKSSVRGHTGRFNGLAGGGTTDVIAKVATQLGWDSRGHFLAFAVIARADGSTIAAGDPTTTKIINTLVEDYLKGTVLQARVDALPASGASAGTATTKPSVLKK